VIDYVQRGNWKMIGAMIPERVPLKSAEHSEQPEAEHVPFDDTIPFGENTPY
jgi:hypothetical protein